MCSEKKGDKCAKLGIGERGEVNTFIIPYEHEGHSGLKHPVR